MGASLKCIVSDCEDRAQTRGTCAYHYYRMARGHDPDIRLPSRGQGGRKPGSSYVRKRTVVVHDSQVPTAKVMFSIDGKRSVIIFAEKLIRMLELRAAEAEDPKVMAGYLGAMQTTKLLALTVDPCALTELTQEFDGSLRKLKKKLQARLYDRDL
jgi:hypothetical protein